jgi:hypothetical protein
MTKINFKYMRCFALQTGAKRPGAERLLGRNVPLPCTAIMAIAGRSCCDCTAFTLRLLAMCGRLYRVLSDSTTFSLRSYCDLSVFMSCSKRCLPMMTGMNNTCIMVRKKGKAKNGRQNYVNISNDDFTIIPNVINVVATIYR